MYDSCEQFQGGKERKEARIVDYRNGKYQGATAGRRMLRTGVGMVLDHNYLLALAGWKAGRVEGEALIVYPDNSLFAGRIQNALPAGICTYQVSKKCKIYAAIGGREEDLFVFEDSKSRSLVFLAIAREVMQKMSQDPTANEYILLQESKHNSAGVRMRQQNNYSSEDEKWDAIEKFLKTMVKTQHKDYKQFVKYHFTKRRGDSEIAVEIGQAKQQFQFNFKNSSIICRLMQNKTNDAEFRVKLMGYYDHIEQKMQISKKSVSGTSSIEESVKGEGIVYSETPIQRPTQCVKSLHRYYRESLNFHNDYIEIDYLYRIKFIFHSIEEYIVHTSTNQYAQQLLENIAPSPEKKRPPADKETRYLPVSQEAEFMNRDHLSKVRDDIYKAAQKKSLSKSHSTAQNKVNSYQEENSKYGQIFSKSPSKHEESLYERMAHSPKRKEKKYLEEEDHSLSKVSVGQGQGRKSYVYLDQSIADRQEKSKNKERERATPGKYEYSKGLPERKQEPSSQLSKFAYLDKTEAKRTNKKLQNLKTLTEYYEQIENQLRKQTPKKSNKTSKNFELSSNRLSPKPDTSSRRTDTRPPSHHPVSTSPLGGRRSYKYV